MSALAGMLEESPAQASLSLEEALADADPANTGLGQENTPT
jgi:hypothetical protein